MAKARKKTRKAAARRPAKKTRSAAVRRKSRKVAKTRAKSKRAKPQKQGVISGAVQTVTDTLGLHGRLAGHNTFED